MPQEANSPSFAIRAGLTVIGMVALFAAVLAVSLGMQSMTAEAQEGDSDFAPGPPTVTKDFVGSQNGTAEWLITVSTPFLGDFQGFFGYYQYELFDESATSVSAGPNYIGPCFFIRIAGVPGAGVSCNRQDSNTTQDFVVVTEYVPQCEEQVLTNTVTGDASFLYANGATLVSEFVPQNAVRLGETWPLSAEASATIPGDRTLCPSTITVRKFFDNDEDGDFSAGDPLINGWGMSVNCDDGNHVAAGSTGADGLGTVVFTVPFDVQSCLVTETTILLVSPVGYVTYDNPIQPGTSAVIQLDGIGGEDHPVAFLNDPGDQPTPTPTTPPSTPAATPTPETPTPEPTEPAVVETPAPETPQPDTPEPVVESTPIAPDAGSGLASSGGRMAVGIMLLAVALLASGGALGTFTMARGKRT